jgi:hypothetical protein
MRDCRGAVPVLRSLTHITHMNVSERDSLRSGYPAVVAGCFVGWQAGTAKSLSGPSIRRAARTVAADRRPCEIRQGGDWPGSYIKGGFDVARVVSVASLGPGRDVFGLCTNRGLHPKAWIGSAWQSTGRTWAGVVSAAFWPGTASLLVVAPDASIFVLEHRRSRIA